MRPLLTMMTSNKANLILILILILELASSEITSKTSQISTRDKNDNYWEMACHVGKNTRITFSYLSYKYVKDFMTEDYKKRHSLQINNGTNVFRHLRRKYLIWYDNENNFILTLQSVNYNDSGLYSCTTIGYALGEETILVRNLNFITNVKTKLEYLKNTFNTSITAFVSVDVIYTGRDDIIDSFEIEVFKYPVVLHPSHKPGITEVNSEGERIFNRWNTMANHLIGRHKIYYSRYNWIIVLPDIDYPIDYVVVKLYTNEGTIIEKKTIPTPTLVKKLYEGIMGYAYRYEKNPLDTEVPEGIH